MNKRNLYLFLIGIITVICIITGTIIHLNKNNINNFIKNFNEDDFIEEIPLDNFSKISIEGKVLGVEIKSGEDVGLKMYYSKDFLRPYIYYSGDTLIIEQNSKRKLMGNYLSTIVLTVPKNINLQKLDIEINVGEINLKDLNIDNINIETNVGEIDIENVQFVELEAESNVGEIKLSNLAEPLKEYNMQLSTNVGEISVGEDEFKKNYSQIGNIETKIELCTNVGEIIIL